MSGVRCRLAELGEEFEVRSFMSGHAEHCLACQARAARDHRIRRVLRASRNELELAPTGFQVAVASRIHQEPADELSRRGVRRILAAAGAVVAGAAGAVALTVWRRTHSPA